MIYKMIKKISNMFHIGKGNNKDDVFSLKTEGYFKGTALLSYIKEAVNCDGEAPCLKNHSNFWECREIANVFVKLGYNVDVCNWDCDVANPKKYDVIFDIHQKIGNERYSKIPIKILYITGSYPKYQNKRARERVQDFNARHEAGYAFFREADEESFDKSLNAATYLMLIGNEHTKLTFPSDVVGRMCCVPVTSSPLPCIKDEKSYVPPEKEFLFFSGVGAVHKGLDLVLQAFLKHPEYKLNIVGDFSEENFLSVYDVQMKNLKNVHYYGFLTPESEAFKQIVSRCFCYVFPSCSEGTSAAAITALSIGMYPILSSDSGVDLPKGKGVVLENLNVESIEQAIKKVFDMPKEELVEQIRCVQEKILKEHSRRAFSETITKCLGEALKK